jgi:hypothetical protein
VADRGLDVAGSFYRDVVGPALDRRWPDLPHAAARLGSGSDVLGLDDETSRDHDWGLRLNLLVDASMVDVVRDHLGGALPTDYRGLPVRFSVSWDDVDEHRVQVEDPAAFLVSRLGVDPLEEMGAAEWLALSSQSVLEVTAGRVLTDTDGRLTAARDKLAWYPHDIWLYVVAAQWRRIAQDLHVFGRVAQRGDDLGERLLAARLVQSVMRLGFLLERTWAPYPKWFGLMFAQLPRAGPILGSLGDALSGSDSMRRRARLVDALEAMNAIQRAIGLPTAAAVVEPFWNRPYPGVTDATVETLLDALTDDELLRARGARVIGSIDQWCDNVDVLTNAAERVRIARAAFGGR